MSRQSPPAETRNSSSMRPSERASQVPARDARAFACNTLAGTRSLANECVHSKPVGTDGPAHEDDDRFVFRTNFQARVPQLVRGAQVPRVQPSPKRLHGRSEAHAARMSGLPHPAVPLRSPRILVESTFGTLPLPTARASRASPHRQSASSKQQSRLRAPRAMASTTQQLTARQYHLST
jgi:hypothetical protein